MIAGQKAAELRMVFATPRSAPPLADAAADLSGHYTTLEAAALLGLAVRSVQLMVDRGELDAWKTPGGHRRISRESVHRRRAASGRAPERPDGDRPARPAGEPLRVLLIEDSVHFQNLVALLLRQHFPEVELRIAADGIVGLALVGQWQPDVLVVDILLPGIDGATLITSLRTHPQFSRHRLIVVTSLDAADRAPYEFALAGVPVVHKPRLVAEFPPLLRACLADVPSRGAAA
jgi:excisionase family DNA binding protein